jgi:hypothetical protein
MALKKLSLKPGVNRENTRYTNENGWYESQWVRFRQGTPEKIGGFAPYISPDGFSTPFDGVARSVLPYTNSYDFATFANTSTIPTRLFVATNQGAFSTRRLYPTGEDLRTPLVFPLNPSSATGTVDYYIENVTCQIIPNSPTASEAEVRLTFNSTTTGVVSNSVFYIGQQVKITNIGIVFGPPNDLYTVYYAGVAGSSFFDVRVKYTPVGTMPSPATVNTGKVSVYFEARPDIATTLNEVTLWSQSLFGNSVIFNRRGGPIYVDGYSLNALGLPPSPSLAPASAPPINTNFVLVSDVSRFVFAFGTQPYYTTPVGGTYPLIQPVDPLLIRWSDQEDYAEWAPAATNQAGELRLSRGSEIITAIQARQEILVWTDTALYTLQFVGAPVVWGAQIVGDNITIISQNAAAYAGGTAYWMGDGKFYRYRGTVETLRCDLRRYVFEDIDPTQNWQVTAGTNEQFNEVWWRYVSKDAATTLQPNKYVVYNYVEDIWYYGSDDASAQFDTRLGYSTGPLKARATMSEVPSPTASTIIYQMEYRNDWFEYGAGNVTAIPAYIISAEFDLDDGHQFMFAWRMLPDMTFAGSDTPDPEATPPIPVPSVQYTLLPMKNSGSGVTNPASVGGDNEAQIVQTAPETTYTIEEFTGQVYTRIRARQLMIKVSSDTIGVAWQLGSPRLDMRTDGRR